MSLPLLYPIESYLILEKMQSFRMVRQIVLRTLLVAQVLALIFFAFVQTMPFIPFDFISLFKNANASNNFLLNFTSNYFIVVQSLQQTGLNFAVCKIFFLAFICPFIWLFVNKIYVSIINVEKKGFVKLNNNDCINDYDLYILNNKLIC